MAPPDMDAHEAARRILQNRSTDTRGAWILAVFGLFVLSSVLWAVGYHHHAVADEDMPQVFGAAAPIALVLVMLGFRAFRRRTAGGADGRGAARPFAGVRGLALLAGGAALGFGLSLLACAGLLLLINGGLAGADEVHRATVRGRDQLQRSTDGGPDTRSRSYTLSVIEVDDWTGADGLRRIADNTTYFSTEDWRELEVGDEVVITTRPGLLGWTRIVRVEPAAE